MTTIQYRVRPVTRYVVTRYSEDAERRAYGCEGMGEFDNERQANHVMDALFASDPAEHKTKVGILHEGHTAPGA